MLGNSKHSNYVIIFANFFNVVDVQTYIVFFYIQLINHHTYIELSCYLIKTPTMLRFSAIIIY